MCDKVVCVTKLCVTEEDAEEEEEEEEAVTARGVQIQKQEPHTILRVEKNMRKNM